jgi:hypothetical protein
MKSYLFVTIAEPIRLSLHRCPSFFPQPHGESIKYLDEHGSVGFFDWLREDQSKIVGVRFHVSMMSDSDLHMLKSRSPRITVDDSGNYLQILFVADAKFNESLSDDVDLGFSAIAKNVLTKDLVVVLEAPDTARLDGNFLRE